MSILSAASRILVFSIFCSSCSSKKEVVKADEKPVDDPYSLLVDDEEDAIDYFDENAIRFEDYTYKDDIKSVQLHPLGDPLAYPIIALNPNQRLELHFDDMGNDLPQYYYRLYHCNADWTRSDIIEMQYLDGFFSDILNNYDMSFNTLVPYVHYSVTIPNESMR
ncbi:MAG: DUF5103 domain-containing protein, partial [Flavobacteriales bacterium]|nr:DUF5103 domain-containing protein [Flavobacteriales bacterium]